MVLHSRSGTSRTNHPVANLLEQLESRTLLSTVVFPSATVTTGQMVAIADFNGDGLEDIASSGTVDSLSVYASIKFGTIGGGFSPSTVLEAAPSGSLFGGMPLLAADFDGNGTIDLLAGNARLYLGIGDGTFGAAVPVNVPGSPAAFQLLDADLDGQAEIISTDLTGAISFYRFQGVDFVAFYSLTATPGTSVIDVAEIDGNPGLDILTLDAAGNYIPFLRTSATSYAAGPSFQNGSMFAAIGSLDSDAFPDLYFIAPNQIEPSLFVARGTGAGAFAPATNTGIPASRIHMVNDLDGDGRSEIVISDPGISSTEYVYYAGGTDQPSPQSAEVLVDANRLRSVRYVAFARLGGDSRIDLLIGAGPLNPSQPPTTAQIWTAADAPSAAEIVLPSSPVIPGQLFSITASSVTFPQAGSQHRRVQFTFDLNADGVAQIDEPTFAAQSVGESDWTATILATDGLISCGNFRIVASISDRNTRGTVSSSNTVSVWYRVYYAEGWRNDDSVTEFVPLVNPNDVAVEYRIYARYEVGERDQLIASGTIAPHSRGGVTISERFRPSVALVRANEGYALEVQSSLAIGAFISHYDDWGGVSRTSSAIGEAMTNFTSSRWGFADVSTSRLDFLLFYNPYGTSLTVTVSFLTDALSSTVTFSLGAFRRGGLSLRDLPQLAANSSYAAIIEADGQLLASISSYTPAAGNGSAAIGQLLADASQTQSVGSSLGTFELGGAELPDIVAFNPLPYTVNVTLTFMFDNDEPGRQESIIILPRQRVRISVPAPTGPRVVSVMANANRQILYEASASSASRADSVSTAVATYAADTWAFADAFLNRELAGVSFLEHLSIFNPGTNAADMTVQFLFPDGRRESRTLTVGAGRTRVLALHEDPLITEQSSDAWYSIIVTGTNRTVCTFTHWDLLNGGGWTSLGTPMGNVGGF